jgi:hypothetical protein
MQQAAQQVATSKVAPSKPFSPASQLPSTSTPTINGPQRDVFGFALASSLSDPSVGDPTWDFSLLSTVAFFGLHVQNDGTFAATRVGASGIRAS